MVQTNNPNPLPIPRQFRLRAGAAHKHNETEKFQELIDGSWRDVTISRSASHDGGQLVLTEHGFWTPKQVKGYFDKTLNKTLKIACYIDDAQTSRSKEPDSCVKYSPLHGELEYHSIEQKNLRTTLEDVKDVRDFDDFFVDLKNPKFVPAHVLLYSTHYHYDIPFPATLELVRLTQPKMKELRKVMETGDPVTWLDWWSPKLEARGRDSGTAYEPLPKANSYLEWDEWGGCKIVGSTHLAGVCLRELPLNNLDHPALNLECSDLSHSSMTSGKLKRANFKGAKLHQCNFTGSRLIECEFRGTECWNASFVDCYLKDAKFSNDRPGGDCAFLDTAHFTPIKRNRFGAKDMVEKGGAEGYEEAGSGTMSLTRLAWNSNVSTLQKHQNELQFLLGELDRLREVNVTSDNWQEFYDSWVALEGMHDIFTSSTAKAAITHLFSGAKDTTHGGLSMAEKLYEMETHGPRHALGMAEQLYEIRGKPPRGLLLQLTENVGRKLRIRKLNENDKTYFQIVIDLREEIDNIQAILDMKAQILAVCNGVSLSVCIGITNYFANALSERYAIFGTASDGYEKIMENYDGGEA